MSPKAKKITGWVLVSLLSLLMIGSAMGKFTADPATEMGQQFAKMGVWDNRFLIGGLEMLCAILLLIPRTSTIGVLLTAGYWGGATATEITHSAFQPIVLILMAMLGLVALLRNPELFQRILGKPLQQ